MPLDASGRQHFLDHPQTGRKLEVQADGVADHFSREAVAGMAGRFFTIEKSFAWTDVTGSHQHTGRVPLLC